VACSVSSHVKWSLLRVAERLLKVAFVEKLEPSQNHYPQIPSPTAPDRGEWGLQCRTCLHMILVCLTIQFTSGASDTSVSLL
jgi:hypothetical protein